jgi:HK97 family phage major capsid protein
MSIIQDDLVQIAAEMRDIADRVDSENRNMTAAEQKRWAKLERDSQLKEAQLRAEQADWPQVPTIDGFRVDGRPASEAEVNAVRMIDPEKRPGVRPTQRGPGGAGTFIGVDRDGNSVRSLGVNDSYQAATRTEEDEQWDGLTLGGLCRAYVRGPRTDVERRALNEGTNSAGGFAVPSPLAGRVVDSLKAKTTVIRAGAQIVPMTSKTLDFAKMTTDPTATWTTEAAALSDNSPVLARTTLTPIVLYSLGKASEELIEDSVGLTDALERSFAAQFAIALDTAALEGSGSGEPEGLLNITNVNEVDHAGATLSYSPLYTALESIYTNNSEPPTAFILHPRDYADLMRLTNGDSVWYPPAPWAGFADAYQNLSAELRAPSWFTTTSISVTRTNANVSPSTPTGSTAYLGDFRDMVIGVRREFNIKILDELYRGNRQIGFLATTRVDVQVFHPTAFARIIDIAS